MARNADVIAPDTVNYAELDRKSLTELRELAKEQGIIFSLADNALIQVAGIKGLDLYRHP